MTPGPHTALQAIISGIHSIKYLCHTASRTWWQQRLQTHVQYRVSRTTVMKLANWLDMASVKVKNMKLVWKSKKKQQKNCSFLMAPWGWLKTMSIHDSVHPFPPKKHAHVAHVHAGKYDLHLHSRCPVLMQTFRFYDLKTFCSEVETQNPFLHIGALLYMLPRWDVNKWHVWQLQTSCSLHKPNHLKLKQRRMPVFLLAVSVLPGAASMERVVDWLFVDRRLSLTPWLIIVTSVGYPCKLIS